MCLPAFPCDDHLPLSEAPRALDAGYGFPRQLSAPAASTPLILLLAQGASRRPLVPIFAHLLSKRKRACHDLKQPSPPLPWYRLILQPCSYFFSA